MDNKTNLDPIRDIDIENTSFSNLSDQMLEAGGFSAKKFADGVNIFAEFIQKKDCLKFLSIPAAPLSTGLRGVIKHLIKKKMFDVIVTTCGIFNINISYRI